MTGRKARPRPSPVVEEASAFVAAGEVTLPGAVVKALGLRAHALIVFVIHADGTVRLLNHDQYGLEACRPWADESTEEASARIVAKAARTAAKAARAAARGSAKRRKAGGVRP